MFFAYAEEAQQIDKKSQSIAESAAVIAQSNSNALIHGAAGTGKTLMAHWIHHQSRPHKVLKVISCRELQSGLISFERALFEAEGGTLVLESIDQCSLHMQEQILEMIKNQSEVQRARILCTSRRDLRHLVRKEIFRQDLYYRLAIFNLEISPLQDRSNDILPLAQFFIQVSRILHNRANLQLDEAARSKLLNWSWPGNVSELENVIERAVALATDSTIGEQQIIFESITLNKESDLGLGLTLSEVEKRLIIQTLEMTAQNRTRAAQILGISIRTLRNKLNEYKEVNV
jgi:two-component system, NtrC family, response regulator AtoC